MADTETDNDFGGPLTTEEIADELVSKSTREQAASSVAFLNDASEGVADAMFRSCCAADKWVHAMIERRPFLSESDMEISADECAGSLTREDWMQAFAAHPRIGDQNAS